MASLAFLGLGAQVGLLSSAPGLYAGLVLCMLGDLMLLPEGKKRWLLAGMATFIGGHLWLGGVFAARALTQGVSPTGLGVSLLVVLGGGGVAAVALLPRIATSWKKPVVGYLVVLSLMVLAAGALGLPWPLLPAIAFYLSDLAVALQRFVSPGLTHRLWGLPLYYGAMLWIAMGG